MNKKNKISQAMKEYISEALLLILQNKEFHLITIGEITKRAGVNRSTYYRNFNSKEDIIKFYYSQILQCCITDKNDKNMEEHLINIFQQFMMHKENLLCLHRNNLSYLLLEALNVFFTGRIFSSNTTDIRDMVEIYYHTGGIFNTFLLWFDSNMSIEPSRLAKETITILPNDFKPMLQ